MLYLIEPKNYVDYREDLDNMYRFRHRIFFDKMQWDVKSQDGMEKDEYDEQNAYYLVYKDEEGIIRGCVRFIEMTNPCMFDGVFNFALPNLEEFKKKGYWETSRFAVDTNSNHCKLSRHTVTKSLLAGLINFGLKSKRVECYLTLTHPSVHKLSQRYGLFSFDIKLSYIENEAITVWAFTPMAYSFDRLSIK